MDLRPRPAPRTPGNASPAAAPAERHGSHTLKVWKGAVVGVYGRDVFVELGPRMQGVIDVRSFATKPQPGDTFEFTLRGQEEGLWALQLAETKPLVRWEEMEPGSVVLAHVVRVAPGGLEVKIGPLHAFLPKSHTGLDRDEDVRVLVGKNFAAEVLEVDRERQRVVVSRKLVLQRERASEHQRHVGQVVPGDVVQGRVTRIEPYGAFVTFGHGLQGLVHVSNLSHARVEHAGEVVALGQSLELRVLHVKQGGKRIGLGLKQMAASPWLFVERSMYAGQIVSAQVTRLTEHGAFVRVRDGVEGLVPLSQAGLAPGQPLRAIVAPGKLVSLRVLDLDPERERMTLSLLHEDGRHIAADEAENLAEFRARAEAGGVAPGSAPNGAPGAGAASHAPASGGSGSLGDALRRALAEREKRAS